MSERTRQAILARERATRGEPEQGTYRDLQERAKDLGIPANQASDKLVKAIEKAEEQQVGDDSAA